MLFYREIHALVQGLDVGIGLDAEVAFPTVAPVPRIVAPTSFPHGRHEDNYELVIFDKEGRYPREDAAIWNEDFIKQVAEHPEWLAPQEDADILVRYIFPLKDIDN